VSGIAPEYNVIDGVVELVVSGILDHEVIALDLDHETAPSEGVIRALTST
jgi:hypothetical protein